MFRKLGFTRKRGEESPKPSEEITPSDINEEVREDRETFFTRLIKGLAKTRKSFISNLRSVLRGRVIDAELLEDLEEVMITADIGINTTSTVIEEVRKKAAERDIRQAEDIIGLIKESLLESLEKASLPLPRPDRADTQTIIAAEEDDTAAILPERADGGLTVVMVVGVNGVGKTTTIGKLAYSLRQGGKKVMLAACDTFRAAAVEQLGIWAARAGADIIKGRSGGDPSAVIYDSIQAARARGHDVIIADTAGRLHTKVNLMEELKKMKRVISREVEGAPHEVLLVLDATIGQNALSQARLFHEALGVTGIALAKVDGTAKGGVVIGIVNELGIPLKFIGIGEKLDDLRPFNPREFVEALFQDA